MTRKDELEERVEKLASRFERIGESQAQYEIVEALLQVEREVWERAAQEVVYHAYAKDFAIWCRLQKEQL